MKGGSLNEEDRAVMDLVRLNEYIGKLVEEATREGHVDDLVKQNPDPGPVAPHMPFPTRRQRSPIPSRIALTGSRTASVYSPSSRFWRYATSETLIGSIGAAGFGAFLYATKNFQNMSLGLDRFCKDILNIHAPSLSQYAIAAIYAVSMASVLLITGIRTSRQVAAKAQLLHELDNASEDIKGMRRYVSRSLNAIKERTPDPEEQSTALENALKRDERLFPSMDALRDDERQLVHAWDKSGLSRKVNVREILDRVEKAILQDKLQTLGAFIENQDVRLSHFKELYEQDPLFKKKCDQLFATNAKGHYINPSKQKAIFEDITDGVGHAIGAKLLEACQHDYRFVSVRYRK